MVLNQSSLYILVLFNKENLFTYENQCVRFCFPMTEYLDDKDKELLKEIQKIVHKLYGNLHIKWDLRPHHVSNV